MQFLAIYVHIPFCLARCSYCAFNIYTDRLAIADSYIAALGQEAGWLGRGEPVHTLYFGGGTPSLLTLAQVEAALGHLHQGFQILPDAEITFEINPETVDHAYLVGLRDLGVNRLSIGMQSAHQSELALYGRHHTLDGTAACYAMARQAGFQNISLDLIYGAPAQTLEQWDLSLQTAITFGPEHFSLYAMQLESGTRLTNQVKRGELPKPDDDLVADMYDLATERLAAAGYEQYEISSWCKPDYASQHNLQYWRNRPYLGLGAGAHGCAGGERTANIMRPENYIQRLANQYQPLAYPRTAATQLHERIDAETEKFETVMLNLRLLQEGLSREAYQARYGESLESRYGAEITRLKAGGLLKELDGVLTLTPQARLISNRVFEAFLPESAS